MLAHAVCVCWCQKIFYTPISIKFESNPINDFLSPYYTKQNANILIFYARNSNSTAEISRLAKETNEWKKMISFRLICLFAWVDFRFCLVLTLTPTILSKKMEMSTSCYPHNSIPSQNNILIFFGIKLLKIIIFEIIISQLVE